MGRQKEGWGDRKRDRETERGIGRQKGGWRDRKRDGETKGLGRGSRRTASQIMSAENKRKISA